MIKWLVKWLIFNLLFLKKVSSHPQFYISYEYYKLIYYILIDTRLNVQLCTLNREEIRTKLSSRVSNLISQSLQITL